MVDKLIQIGAAEGAPAQPAGTRRFWCHRSRCMRGAAALKQRHGDQGGDAGVGRDVLIPRQPAS